MLNVITKYVMLIHKGKCIHHRELIVSAFWDIMQHLFCSTKYIIDLAIINSSAACKKTAFVFHLLAVVGNAFVYICDSGSYVWQYDESTELLLMHNITYT